MEMNDRLHARAALTPRQNLAISIR